MSHDFTFITLTRQSAIRLAFVQIVMALVVVFSLAKISSAQSLRTSSLQIMLFPQFADTPIAADSISSNSQKLVDFYQSIETGIESGLSNKDFSIVDRRAIYSSCQTNWCDQGSLKTLVDNIKSWDIDTQLLVFYLVDEGQPQKVTLRLIDPFSFNLVDVLQIDLIDEYEQNMGFDLGIDLARLLSHRLQNHQLSYQYKIKFTGFKLAELKGLNTHVISYPQNTTFLLQQSDREDRLFGRYLPVVNSTYLLKSNLYSSQVNQLLLHYFSKEELSVSISLTSQDANTFNLELSRKHSPYIPSQLSLLFVFCLLIAGIVLLVRRQYLQSRLVDFSEKRDASNCLAIYKKAKFPLYFLNKKWISHASVWQRAAQESQDYARQAEIYLTAGDDNTAKLFVSKALHADSANTLGRNIASTIEKREINSFHLSNSEQAIRNKIAKAMNNAQQQSMYKACKQLYQALAMSKKEKALKKQAKAISKLIKKVNNDFYQNIDAVVIKGKSDITNFIVCNNSNVQLGRLPNKLDKTYISKQDSVFCINHKSVSRLGHQCAIYYQAGQYQESQFSLIDLGSKNGSFVNKKPLSANKAHALTNKDLVQLGSDKRLSAVNFVARVSKNQKYLSLCLDKETLALFTQDELNKVWPDSAFAINNSLVCAQTAFVLAVNNKTKALSLIEAEDYDNAKAKAKFEAICSITLGSEAQISPFLDKANKQAALQINEQELLGCVPLILPCTLRYEDSLIDISVYDNSLIPASNITSFVDSL